MSKNKILEIVVIVIAVLNIPLWYFVLTYDLPVFSGFRTSEPTAVQAAVEPVETSMRLQIPSLHIDAVMETVGLTAAGSMAVPKDPMNVGWYELGPRPGEPGNAVLAGHIDWYGGVTGVFADLDQLKPGDQIVTVDEAGVETIFIVRELKTMLASADASEIFFSTDNQAHLNLITCSGAWDKSAKQYTTRLVVFADAFTPPKK